jgi:peroxiredoxin Q/BCP
MLYMKLIIILVGIVFAVLWLRTSQAADLPKVGQEAPDFALPDQAGKLQKLSDYRGQWVVLYFYPKDDTPHCTTEACQFRDDAFQLHQLGAVVLGVSVDDADSHAEFAKKHHLAFPLLADRGGVVADSYGSVTNLLVIKFAKRNTFLINPQGKIAKVYVSVDAQQHAKSVLQDLTALSVK